jgi:hypothetical protein
MAQKLGTKELHFHEINVIYPVSFAPKSYIFYRRKSLLRLLGEHCTDTKEKHQLLHLSSRGKKRVAPAIVLSNVLNPVYAVCSSLEY